MFASLPLPEKYAQWNRAHGGPSGYPIRRLNRWFSSTEMIARLRGPFALQPNNSIRAFEYPWAFEAGNIQSGQQLLEIGGGLGGFQFVLDQQGCQVTNVDPGMDGEGWPCNAESMKKLNARFGTQVKLINTTIAKASLPDACFDRVFSISVIEHLGEADATSVLKQAHRCLKTDGLLILTVDLFLNLKPFCSRETNHYGTNQNLQKLIDEKLWDLQLGDRSCLYGFSEFSADRTLSNLEKYMIGYYPALAQCLVLRKR
jgi:SAM-dependent methyltransferase